MIVGLTGGIGSGKSTVSRLFEMFGCVVFNSDRVAKEIYYDPGIRKKIIELLGASSYLPDGNLNKSFISSRIFGDAVLLHKLNSIIHPAVREKMQVFIETNKDKLIIKESALLFEAHLEKELDKVIVVSAPDDLRIKRIMDRDGLSAADVQLRLKSQIPQEEKVARADFVIINNEKELVIPQVLAVFEKLK
jgi:dephospho-CoA kinase